VEHHGLLGAVWNDEYLAATIDRKAAQRSFEVIATITYRGARHTYGSAQFRVRRAGRGAGGASEDQLANCPTGECTYTDRVSFSVEEVCCGRWRRGPLRTNPRCGTTPWSQSRAVIFGTTLSAEVAGFLATVDEYTGAAPPPSVHRGPGQTRMGLGGLQSRLLRNYGRGGVLVTAVSRARSRTGWNHRRRHRVRIDGHPSKPAGHAGRDRAAAADAAITITVYRA